MKKLEQKIDELETAFQRKRKPKNSDVLREWDELVRKIREMDLPAPQDLPVPTYEKLRGEGFDDVASRVFSIPAFHEAIQQACKDNIKMVLGGEKE